MRDKRGKFKEGNPGKPKGTLNRKTVLWHELSEWFIDKGASKFIKEIQSLKGKEYVHAYSLVLEYFKPKLSRIEVSDEVDNEPGIRELFEMSPQERTSILLELKEQIKNEG